MTYESHFSYCLHCGSCPGMKYFAPQMTFMENLQLNGLCICLGFIMCCLPISEMTLENSCNEEFGGSKRKSKKGIIVVIA